MQDFARRSVRDFFVDDFLVAVEREVIALGGDVGFGDEEALRGAFARALRGFNIREFRFQRTPAGKDVGEVVFGVIFEGEGGLGDGAELFRWEEFGAFVVEGQAVGVHVVEPNVVGAAGVGFGEEEALGSLPLGKKRRLTFDQVHDNYPTMMPDGTVVYTRWENAAEWKNSSARISPSG